MPPIGFYDYLTFASILIVVIGFLTVLCLILGLPGRIARNRNHPEANAIYVMGWLGFLGGVPWIQAFIWAFKPTDVVDIRRFPKQEAEAEREERGAPSQAEKPLRHENESDSSSAAEKSGSSDTDQDKKPQE